ncbi:hypothetical protein QYE76_043382 [Lolium multiflorum]|uniref:Uncharacterized protein n=1 Tax=Lolium multiflorum TaxID=4521 RepID=A0AAD8WW06_LOLMU|nr:hypothetical protein QYE76_043382 [Lolium multiflorum]
MTAFLCPTSHDAVSPDYLHIVENPAEIATFDFSTAVLRKLVSSIEAFNAGCSSLVSTDEECKDQSGSVIFKVPSHVSSVSQTPLVELSTIPPAICLPGQTSSSHISDVATMHDVDCEMDEHVCNDGCLLPVPGDDILDRLNEEALKDGLVPDINSIICAMESLHSPSSLGQLPCNFQLLEQMAPPKPDFSQYYDSASSGVDMFQYVKDQAAEERKSMAAKEIQSLGQFEKVDFSLDLDSVTSFWIPNPSGSPRKKILSSKKRIAIISNNDFVSESSCLIKRPRMFELNKEPAVQSMNPDGVDNTKETRLNDGDTSFMSPSNSTIVHSHAEATESSYSWDESEFDREFLRKTLQAEAEHESKQRATQVPTHENQAFNVTEISPNKVISVFTSTLVEQDVFKDIVHRVPKTAKSKTVNIVRMGSTWAEHRVFALSMQVYGNVNKYVINMLGKAVIVEDTEKRNLNLLPEDHWKRYFIPCDESALFAKLYENPGTLSRVISHEMIGFKIDSMDLVHVPLHTSGFYYLILINFRLKLFEVLYPNTKFRRVKFSMSTSVTEDTRVPVSKFLLSKLGLTAGPVTNLFVAKTPFCFEPAGVFKCIHVIFKLVGTEFDFIVNQSRECEVIVRCTTPVASAKLHDVLPLTFKFDEARVKIYKVSSHETLPEDEDIFLKEPAKTFSASMENRSITEQKLLGYPVGYSDESLDMESEENIRMTDTAMKILGVSEGSQEGLVRVNLKYLLSPEYIAHAYSVVQFPELVKFAVDYNSKLYMKFNIPMMAEVMTKNHYFVDRFMIKFYSVKTVKKCSFMEDIGRKCPVYSRLKNEDHFEDHFQSA